MTKTLFSALLISCAIISTAQQDSKTMYQDTLDNEISSREYEEKMKSGKYDNAIKVGSGIVTFMLRSKSTARKPIGHENNFFHQPKYPLLDNPFPDFNLKDIDGKETSLAQLKGKIVVLNFWFIGCKPCISELPLLNRIVTHYIEKRDVVFLAPTFDDRYHTKKFLETHKFLYKVLPLSKELDQKLGISAYPTHMIVDKRGILQDVIRGSLDTERTLIDAIDLVVATADH